MAQTEARVLDLEPVMTLFQPQFSHLYAGCGNSTQLLGQQEGFCELKGWDKFGAQRCYGEGDQGNYAGVFHLLLGPTFG